MLRSKLIQREGRNLQEIKNVSDIQDRRPLHDVHWLGEPLQDAHVLLQGVQKWSAALARTDAETSPQ